MVCFLLLLKREIKMSDTCSLFSPLGGPWPSCLLPPRSLLAMRRLLIAGPSLVAERRPQGTSASVGAVIGSVTEALPLQSTGSVVAAHGLSGSKACRIFPDQDRIHVFCTGRQILYCSATREAPSLVLMRKSFPFNAIAPEVLYRGRERKAEWMIRYRNKVSPVISHLDMLWLLGLGYICVHLCVSAYVHACVYTHVCACLCVCMCICEHALWRWGASSMKSV